MNFLNHINPNRYTLAGIVLGVLLVAVARAALNLY
jgi:hypothetical protein